MAKKPDSRRGPRDRKLRRDESELFRAAVRDTRPLGKRGAEKPPAPAPGKPAKPAAAPSRPALPDMPSSAGDLPELRPGAPAGVDARTMERLRRGRLRPEARLDLHGMFQDEAHSALRGFIADCRGAGRRCVIVITGKGRLSDGGGVLRTQVPRWLNLPALRPHILGFSEAQPKDGGGGALYVLLRRERSRS